MSLPAPRFTAEQAAKPPYVLGEVLEAAQAVGADPAEMQGLLNGLMQGPREELATALESLDYERQMVDWLRDEYQSLMQQGYSATYDNVIAFDWPSRRARIVECRYAATRNPIAKQSLRLIEDYTLGGGLTYRLTGDQAEDAEDTLADFWDDPIVADVLTSSRAQKERLHDLMTDGDIYLAFFVEQAACTVMDIPAAEVEDIITDPDNRRKVLAYKRSYYPRIYNQKTGEYQTANDPTVLYYADLGSYGAGSGKLKTEADVYVMHVRINSTAKWGVPEVYPALEWLRAQKDFMGDRGSIIKALATITWVKKVQSPTPVGGNPDMTIVRQPNYYPNTSSMRPLQSPGPAASTYTSGPNVDLQQMHTDTGAAQAIHDNKLLLAQIGNSFGWYPHHYGDGMDAARATTKSMELPTLKRVQGWQQLLTDLYKQTIAFVLTVAGFAQDDYQSDIEFPPIMEVEIGPRLTALSQIVAAGVFPQNIAASRELVTLTLNTLGENNVSDLVAGMFPDPDPENDRLIPTATPQPSKLAAPPAEATAPNDADPNALNGSAANPNVQVVPNNAAGQAQESATGSQAGDWVRWRTSGAVGYGKVISIHTQSTVRGTSTHIQATAERPAAHIEVYRHERLVGWQPSGEHIAHYLSELTKIDELPTISDS